MKITNVLVNGGYGKLGKILVEAIENSDRFNLVGIGTRSTKLSTLINSTGAEIVVDTTNAGVAFENAKEIINCGCSPLIASSGVDSSCYEALYNLSLAKNRSGVIAPNLSITSLVSQKIYKAIGRYFDSAEVIEHHHNTKLDSPSGTAIKTKELLSNGIDLEKISIHSIRSNGVIANQDVLLCSKDETLTISHHTMSRDCYGLGLIMACDYIVEGNDLIYGLESLIKLDS